MSADLSMRVKMLTQRLSETNDRLHELGRLHRLANWLPEPEVQAEEQELQALYERDRHDRALLNKCIAGDKAAIAQLSKIDADRRDATGTTAHAVTFHMCLLLPARLQSVNLVRRFGSIIRKHEQRLCVRMLKSFPRSLALNSMICPVWVFDFHIS